VKFAVAFILSFLLSTSVSADWKSSHARINGGIDLSGSKFQTNLDGTYSSSHIFTTISKQSLFEGYGINGTLFLSNYLRSTNEVLNKEVNHSALLSSIIFLSQNSDLELEMVDSTMSYFADSDIRNIQRTQQHDFNIEISSTIAKYNLGSDQDFFALNAQLNKSRQRKRLIDSNVQINLNDSFTFNTSMYFKQTEDTFWGAKYSFRDIEENLFTDIRNQSINNSYLSLKTKAFRRSLFEIGVGSSQSNDVSRLSWFIESKTFINDYSSLTLYSSRSFSEPINPKIGTELNTSLGLSFQLAINSYISTSIDYLNEKREDAEIQTYSVQELGMDFKMSYFKDWLVELTANFQKLSDLNNVETYQQQNISVVVLRKFI
jgi:hypothetical protein